jgi:hypothetical protein
MAPNGNIYFVGRHYQADYSKASPSMQHWLMHEMTHVWQYQLGYPVMLRGAIRLGLPYRYRLQKGNSLRHYNLEAQGNLLADYFALKHLGCDHAPAMNGVNGYCQGDLRLYERVLHSFIYNGKDINHLPQGFMNKVAKARRFLKVLLPFKPKPKPNKASNKASNV